jgi:hypothetical protein
MAIILPKKVASEIASEAAENSHDWAKHSKEYRNAEWNTEGEVYTIGWLYSYGIVCQKYPIAQYHSEDDRNKAVACVNACRGLNPAAVPELVDMIEGLLPFAILAQDKPDTDAHAKLAIKMAKELLARVKQ